MADAASYWSAILNGGNPAMFPGQEPALPENPILKVLNKGAKPNALLNAKKVPVVPAGAAGAAPAPSGFEMQLDPVAKGSGLTNKTMEQDKTVDENTDTTKQLTQTNKRLVLDDPTFQQLIARTEGTDVFKRQKAGIDQMRDLLAMSAQTPTDVFSAPLSGLLESEFGKKASGFAAGRGPSPAEQQKSILAYADKIQDDQKDYATKLFEAIGKQQGGSQLDSYLSQLVGRNLNQGIVENSGMATDPNRYEKPARKGGGGPDYSKDVKELGKQRAQVAAPMLNTFQRLNDELKDDGGLAGLRNSASGVKGVGGLGSFVPIGWRDDKSARIYNLAMDLALQKLQMRSGQAASDKEAAKYLKQFGLSPSASAREMQNGLTKLVDDVHSTLYADESRFRPGVVQEYSSHPGHILSSDLDKYRAGGPVNQKAPKASGTGGGAPAAPKRTKELKDMTKAELDAYEKALTGGK